MIQFILTDILMISLGTILFLVARSLPRIGEEPVGKQNMFERWVSSELPEKFDTAFNNFLLKSLRKFKLVLLKADNSITQHLKKITPNGNGKNLGGLTGSPKIDFKDINNSEDAVGSDGAAGVDPVRGRLAEGTATAASGRPASNGIEKTPESGDNLIS